MKKVAIAIAVVVGVVAGRYTYDEINDYSDYKDFDLSKANMFIDTLNSGEMILTEPVGFWGEHYPVIDRGGDRVVSNDSCYLKYRAYRFWENQIKGK